MSSYRREIARISQGYRRDIAGISQGSRQFSSIYYSPWLHPLLLLLLPLKSKKIYLCILLVKSKMNNETTIQYLASYALTYLALSAIDR